MIASRVVEREVLEYGLFCDVQNADSSSHGHLVSLTFTVVLFLHESNHNMATTNRTFNIACLTCAIAILPMAAVILGFTIDNIVYHSSNRGTSTAALQSGSAISRVVLVPSEVGVGAVWALFATGIGGTIDSILLIALFSFSWLKSRQTPRRWFYPVVIFICVVSVVRSLTALAYAFNNYSNSSAFDITNVMADGTYSAQGGSLNLEKWNRGLQQYLEDGSKQSRLATELTASRGLSVSIFVLYIVELALSGYLWRIQRTQPITKPNDERLSKS